MDTEFIGWVYPISNRLVHGVRLYEDGTHVPMPPLPFVLLRLLSHGHAIWLTENTAIMVFLGLASVVLYLGFASRLPRPAALMAAMASELAFLACSKLIFYDALAQCLVAVTAVFVAAVAAPNPTANHDPIAGRLDLRGRRPLFLSVAAGAASACCLLSKQSTAAGLVAGSLLALLCFPRALRLRARLLHAFVYAVVAAATFGLLLLAVRRWVNPSGFLHDCFVRGGEAKGGPEYLERALQTTVAGLLGLVQRGLLFVAMFFAAGLGLRRMGHPQPVDAAPPEDTSDREAALDRATREDWLTAALCLVGALAAFFLLAWHHINLPGEIDSALGIAVVLAVAQWVRPIDPRKAAFGDSLLVLFIVCLATCLTHQLSVLLFRWTYDSNPLIYAVLVLVCIVLVRFAKTGDHPHRRAGMLGVFTFLVIILGCHQLPWRMELNMLATVPWPDVPALKYARMPRDADRLHSMVRMVQNLTAPEESVLLLPNDPNIEAWINRPRPNLSSAILFADQYWDSFVDEDFSRLAENPPSVIIIGPRNYWRNFGRTWQPDRGVERLIDRVTRELLPERYVLEKTQPILFRRGDEAMEIYRLRPPEPSANTAHDATPSGTAG